MTELTENEELVLAHIVDEPIEPFDAIDRELEVLLDHGLAYVAADGYRATEKGRVLILGPLGYGH